MYRIYANGKILHDPHLLNEGCGVISPKLTVELNKAGSLEFVIPPTNALYDDITKLKTYVNVYDDAEEMFRGRVLNDEKDFYKQKKTYCEGDLAFLLDSSIRPYTFNGTPANLFKKFISEHNSHVEKDKQFTVGTVDVEIDNGTTYYENYNYPVTIDEITEKLIDGIGGYIKTRVSGNTRYIDWTTESGRKNSQVIEFGVNMLDITEHITAENIYTVIIPLGASLQDSEGNTTNEKLTIKSVNGGKDYIENTTAVNLFGRIERVVEWSDVDNPTTLKKLGSNLLNQNIEMSISLTLKAVDLHLLNPAIEQIRIGDSVQVISLPHKLNKEFQCTKIVYDLVSPDQTEYTFGVKFTTLTEKQVNEKKNMQSSVSMVLSTAGSVNASVSKVNKAATDVENVIAQLPTDYVSASTFEAYKTEVSENYAALEARVIKLEGGTV